MSISGTERRPDPRRLRRRSVVLTIVAAAALVGAVPVWLYLASKCTVERSDGTFAAVDGRHVFDRDLENSMGQSATLSLVGGSCLGVGDGTIVVWPHGSKLERSGGTVHVRLPGGQIFKTGDRIVFGPRASVSLSGLDLPGPCREARGLVVGEPTLG